MSKPSPAFQFYPHEFLVGTADLTAEEVGAYIRLLCYQWAKDGLPNDDKKLAQLAVCDSDVIGIIRSKFHVCEDGLLRNDKLEKVRTDQAQYRQRQSDNAKEGWKHRPGNATAMPPHVGRQCSLSSSSTLSLTTTVKEGEVLRTKTPKKVLSEEEWMAELRKLYVGVNIDAEMVRMKAWLLSPKGSGRKMSRQFVTNWLNRSDKIIEMTPDKPPAKIHVSNHSVEAYLEAK